MAVRSSSVRKPRHARSVLLDAAAAALTCWLLRLRHNLLLSVTSCQAHNCALLAVQRPSEAVLMSCTCSVLQLAFGS
jgi:hypothetical protein